MLRRLRQRRSGRSLCPPVLGTIQRSVPDIGRLLPECWHHLAWIVGSGTKEPCARFVIQVLHRIRGGVRRHARSEWAIKGPVDRRTGSAHSEKETSTFC